jgi:lipoate---protein ligase
MTAGIRWLDTGLGSARWNIALTAALAELHRAGDIDDSIRFYRYQPSVLIGRHQSVETEVRIDRCRQLNVEIARRMTGGGAVYMDRGVLAWDVVACRGRLAKGIHDASAVLCAGIARGLEPLGMKAVFRPPGDVLVEGRKLCGSSGYADGETLVCQGTILIDVDFARMASLLEAPVAGQVTSIKAITGSCPPLGAVEAAIGEGLSAVLGWHFQPAEPSAMEQALADRLWHEEYGSDAFVLGAAAAA